MGRDYTETDGVGIKNRTKGDFSFDFLPEGHNVLLLFPLSSGSWAMRFQTLAVFIVVSVFFLFSQVAIVSDCYAENNREEYESLLAKVKEGDRNIDFERLRFLFAETANYKPYNNDLENYMLGKMWKALRRGKIP